MSDASAHKNHMPNGDAAKPTPPLPRDEASMEDIASALKTIRADIARLADDVAELARARANEASEKLAGVAANATNAVTQLRTRVDGSMRDADAMLREQIRDNPMSAAVLLISFGYVLGRRRSAAQWRR
jgi:ElaB/YqjD/DUF883 family membrane-anchored ribosome-binding protein